MRKFSAFAAAAALAVVASPALAESANDFQLYVLGDLTLNGNAVNQRTAVGHNATFSSTSLGGATDATPYSLVVGNDLIYRNGGAINGAALVGGANNAFSYMPVTAGAATLPVDFSVENLRLKNLSDTLGGMAATGTAESKWGGLFLTGLNSDLNVFTISSAMLSQASWLSVNIASGSQVLINVTGDNARMSGGLDFGNASNVLWNFVDATSVTASGVSIGGSILAPDAIFNAGGGTIAGKLVAGGFNGSMSFGNAGYSGSFLVPAKADLPSSIRATVPEPGAWLLMILGFGSAGAMLRRRRAVAIRA